MERCMYDGKTDKVAKHSCITWIILESKSPPLYEDRGPVPHKGSYPK